MFSISSCRYLRLRTASKRLLRVGRGYQEQFTPAPNGYGAMSQEETTLVVRFPQGEQFYSSTWELLVLLPEGESWRVPLTRITTRIGSPGQSAHLELEGAPRLQLSWMDSRLVLWVDPKDGEVLVNGQPKQSGGLEVNDEIRWDNGRIQVLDRSQLLLATLECYSSPYLARIWSMDGEPTRIGRRGQRHNQVELDHPTISREHATIFWGARGAVIRSDTSKSVVAVEGRLVASGSEADLLDGVTLQLGELTFRFRTLKEPEARLRGPKLNVHSLGVLQVFRGQETLTEKSWRTNNVRWLLARVALDWGRPVPTDLLLELFWPDLPVASSKNNLNFSLSTLRAALRSAAHPEVDYFIRTRNTLQLHPDLLGEHDYQLFQEALMSARQSNPAAACNYWKKALQLYRGPYLEGCFMDWAQELRQRAHADVLEGGRTLLGYFQSIQDWESVVAVAPQLLQWDPCCQTSSGHLMRAQTERGNPHEAFRVYESCVQNLDRELGVGPGPEVKEAYDLALSRFPE